MSEQISTIFVVDDNPSIRDSLGLLLSSVGYNVESFDSAQNFLESEIIAPEPMCLVLDIRMPGLSGLDLQEELSNRNIQIPIIFITGCQSGRF